MQREMNMSYWKRYILIAVCAAFAVFFAALILILFYSLLYFCAPPAVFLPGEQNTGE